MFYNNNPTLFKILKENYIKFIILYNSEIYIFIYY